MLAVSVQGVSKKYRIFPNGRARLKEALSFGRKKYGHDFWALQDINLEVEPGTTLGILGRNGAGKSTLLNIIAGIRQPTSGTVEVNGRLVALSGLGAGFDSEFTGRENIFLNGLILGIERQEMLERFDDIAAFADIGEFIDQPIKTYSSGMRSRLGFAVAMNVDPDVLILDETLAAGDAVSREAALQKMYELRDCGTTILLVSHGMNTIEDFCTEAILLHKGRILAAGGTTEVINQYQTLTSNIKEGKKRRQTDAVQPPDQLVISGKETPEDPTFKDDHDFERRVAHVRSGTGEARIRSVELLDERLRPVEVVASGSAVTVRVWLEYLEAVEDSELIIALRDETESEETEKQESDFYGPNLGYVLELYETYREDPESVDERTRKFFETWSPPRVEANGHAPAIAGELFSASTALEGIPLKGMEKAERVVVDFTFEVPLRRGRYSISAGVRADSEDSYLDKVDVATTLRIKRPRDRKLFRGVVHLPTEIKVYAPERERQGQSA
jgi:ABC-type polysaccharide/polyol phosphate transport system ATPase subunit